MPTTGERDTDPGAMASGRRAAAARARGPARRRSPPGSGRTRAPAGRCSSPPARRDHRTRPAACRGPDRGPPGRCTARPVRTGVSNRAATLTPSPKMSFASMMMSPTLIPMRKISRFSLATPAFRNATPRWTAIAQATASTALGNSTRSPSPVVLTMRPRRQRWWGRSVRCGACLMRAACRLHRRPSADCNQRHPPPRSRRACVRPAFRRLSRRRAAAGGPAEDRCGRGISARLLPCEIDTPRITPLPTRLVNCRRRVPA